MLKCFLLGELYFLIDGEPLDPFPPQKPQLLLCYLLLHRNRFLPRHVLTHTLWPDRDEPSARRCLSTTLWRLRRSLGDDDVGAEALLVKGDTIGFNPQYACWLDVAMFEQACLAVKEIPGWNLSPKQAQSLQLAADLYRGDFMEGYYDDWCLVERERLAALYLQTLRKLMSYHRYHGQISEAIVYGQRILSIDPLHEDVHRELMRLYYSDGNRVASLRQFDRCREVLAQELGVDPMFETLQLYQDIREGDRIATSPAEMMASYLLPDEMASDSELFRALTYLLECKTQLDSAVQQLEHAMDLIERMVRQHLPPLM